MYFKGQVVWLVTVACVSINYDEYLGEITKISGGLGKKIRRSIPNSMGKRPDFFAMQWVM